MDFKVVASCLIALRIYTSSSAVVTKKVTIDTIIDCVRNALKFKADFKMKTLALNIFVGI